MDLDDRRFFLKSRQRMFVPPSSYETPSIVRNTRRKRKISLDDFSDAVTHLSHHHIDTHLHPKQVHEHYKTLKSVIGQEPKLTDEAHDDLLTKMFGTNNFIQQAVKTNDRLHKLVEKLESKPQTTAVLEDIADHKYGVLANASYEYYGEGGDATKGGEAVKQFMSKHSHYMPELEDFEVVPEYSNKDNLVLRNAKTGETHISFRGTQQLDDWVTNSKAMMSLEKSSPLVKSAIQTAEMVAKDFGTENLTVSGHSMGGMRSLEVTQHFADKGLHVKGWHYDPGTSLRQMVKQGKLGEGFKQTILRTHFDAPSTVANMTSLKPPKNLTIKNILTNPEKEHKVPILDTHKTHHFYLEGDPIGLSNDGTKVLVKRNSPEKVLATALRSGESGAEIVLNSKFGKVAKPIAHYGGKILEKSAKPLAVLEAGFDVYNDLNDPTKSDTERDVDVAMDVGKGVATWEGANIVGELAMAGTLVLCPECALVSAGVGLLAGAGAGIAIEEGFDAVKKPVETAVGKVEDFGETAMEKTKDFVEGVGEGIEKGAEAVGEGIVSGAKSVGEGFVSGAKSVGHFFGF
jgi:hypothetical protein